MLNEQISIAIENEETVSEDRGISVCVTTCDDEQPTGLVFACNPTAQPIGAACASVTAIASVLSAAGREYQLSEGGNAQRLVDKHGDKIRYCTEARSWYIWTNTTWQPEPRELPRIMHMAKDILEDLEAEADAQVDKQEAAQIWSFIKRTDSTSGLMGALRYAVSLPGVAISYAKFDSDPFLVNCRNGTLDLRTGILSAHDPAQLISKAIHLDYDPGMACPVWEKTLEEVFDGDQEVISFFQRAVGYSLSGDTREKVFFVLFGRDGNNGKSLLLSVLRKVLGDYSVTIDPRTILKRNTDAIPNDIARISGYRFVVAEETEHGKELNESLIKQLVSGPGTKMVARFMYSELFEFEPVCKLFLATNHQVAMSPEAAIINRLRVIPFKVTFAGPQKMAELQSKGVANVKAMDDGLYEILLGELPGILAWAVKGYHDYSRQGLACPVTITTATEAYCQDVDVAGRYISERALINISEREPCKRLYQDYRAWCLDNGEKAVSQCILTRQLREKGIIRTDKPSTGGYYYYLGVRLLHQP